MDKRKIAIVHHKDGHERYDKEQFIKDKLELAKIAADSYKFGIQITKHDMLITEDGGCYVVKYKLIGNNFVAIYVDNNQTNKNDTSTQLV